MFVDFNILNQLGSPSINSNTFANRPAAGQTGRLFVSTDTFELYRDNGTGWDLIGGPGSSTVTGTGAAGQVTYWTGASTIGGNNNLFWDSTNFRLGIGTATPGTKLDVHTTAGAALQLNSTNAVGNIYSDYQNQGTTQYRVGYTDDADINYRRFGIYDSVGAKETITIDQQSRYVGINYQYSSLADQPQYTLDVSGSTRATDSSFFATNGTGQVGINTTSPTATALVQANKTDGYGLYLNYTTNTGSGSSTTALWAINNTAGSGYAAVIEEKAANTTGGQYPLLIKHSLSSGTAGVGMGTGVQFQLPDDAGTFKTTQLTVETTDPVAANYSTRYRFNVQSNGSSTAVAYINNVGLGVKTVPSTYNLDVNGSANATTLYENGVRVVTSSGVSGTTNYVAKFTGTNTVGNSVIQDNGTAVGIGITPNSAYKLYVSGKIWGTGVGNAATLTLEDTQLGGATVELNPQYGTGLPILRAGTGFPLLLGGNYTEAARFTSGGNFLIGTTTDAGQKLQVSGTAAFSSSVTAGTTFGINGSYIANADATTGRLLFGDGVSANAALRMVTNSTTIFYLDAVAWGNSSLNKILSINPNGGNVLIGSASDTGDKLYVNGSIRIPSATFFRYDGDTGLIGSGTSISGGAATQLGIRANNDILFATNGANERMRISTGGQVGINTNSTPYGNLTVKSNSATSYYGINVFASSNNNFIALNHTGTVGVIETENNGGSQTDLTFRVNSTERLRITTTNEIQTKGTTVYFGSSNTADLFVSPSTGYFYNEYPTSYGLIWRKQDGTEAMRISGTNLLIGTTTDAGYLLQTNGTAYFDDTVSGNKNFYSGVNTNAISVGTSSAENKKYNYVGYGGYWGIKTTTTGFNFAIDTYNGGTVINAVTLTQAGNFQLNYGSVTTGAPSGGTAAAWKLGSYKAAAVVVSTTNYIEVDIGGTLYKLAVVT